MKQLLIVIGLIFSFVLSFAQANNTFPANGKVGIGTLTPRSTLEVVEWVPSLNISSGKNTEAMVDNEAIGALNFYKHYSLGYAAAIKLLQAGNGDQYSPAHLAFFTTSGGSVYTTVPEERLRITSTGNVGIGTTSPTEKLSVKGKIRAQEIKVETANWPDYVFAKDYQLPSLQETEQHIKNKGHLPGIPSAEEVKANGIDLGDMNTKLLQKIEELTLYLIEKNRKIEAMESRLKKLENTVNNSEKTQSNDNK